MIYYGKKEGGKRVRVSTGTDDWEEAAQFRDAFEREAQVVRNSGASFEQIAEQYLAIGMQGLAETTCDDGGVC